MSVSQNCRCLFRHLLTIYSLYSLLTFLCFIITFNSVHSVTTPVKDLACRSNLIGARCVCNPGNVRCIDTNLQAVPNGIPAGTEQLALTGNQITRIEEGDFVGLETLQTIYLQDNNISYIHPYAFRNLYKLEILNLERNKLVSQLDPLGLIFQHLSSLSRVALQGNSISKLNKYSFLTAVSSPNTIEVKLDQNSITCNCEIQALREWRASLPVGNINFENFKCANDARGRTYDEVDYSVFGQCDTGPPNSTSTESSGQGETNGSNGNGNNRDKTKDKDNKKSSVSTDAVFNTMFKCPVCNKERTNHGCMRGGEVTCAGIGMVCHKTVKWLASDRTMEISSGCLAYQSCLAKETTNRLNCGLDYQPNGSVNCDFCCIGTICSDSIGGRTVDYTLYLSYVRRNAPFEEYMKDKGHPQYFVEEERIDKGLRSVMRTLRGGIDIYVEKFQQQPDNQHKVNLRLELTVFNTDTYKTVSDSISQDIALGMQNASSFVRQENIDSDSLNLGTAPPGINQCPPQETVDKEKGKIKWPVTSVLLTATVPCPYQDPFADEITFATRKCQFNSLNHAQWDPADYSQCITQEEQDNAEIDDILDKPVTTDTANKVSHMLMEYTKNVENFTPEMMDKAVTMLEQLTEPAMLAQSEVPANVMQSVDNLLYVNEGTMRESESQKSTSKRLLAVIDHVPERAPLVGGKLKLVNSRVAVAAQEVQGTETRNLLLSADTVSDDSLKGDGVNVDFANGNAPDSDGSSMVIPTKAIVDSLAPEQKSSLNRVAFAVHQSDRLFAAMENKDRRKPLGPTRSVSDGDDDDDNSASDETEPLVLVKQPNGLVMSASVPGVTVKDLKENITMVFEHNEKNASKPECVYWDQALLAGKGDWSSDGCGVVETSETATTCGCNHLTNFALLMDVYQQGSNLSELDRKILSIISFVGCAISLFALLLTLLTYSFFKKLRRDNPSKILVNLCLALMLSNLVYLVGMHDYAFNTTASCKAVAVLLHYFLLASLSWMAVEAFYMYLALVLVFKTYFTNFILKCSLVGWGIPLVIVIVTLAINKTDNYGFLNSGMCWLKNPAFYAAFVAPVCLILVVNCIAFGLVVRQLMSMSSSKLNKTDRNNTVQRLRGAVGVVILLGLAWLFAIFAIDQASVVFYYLFAIFNSLQGLFIFIFYCLLKKDAISSWKRMLPCSDEYGESSKTSSNSKGAKEREGEANARESVTATAAAHHAVKHESNSGSTSMNGKSMSTDSTAADSRKGSYFNSVSSDHVYNNISEVNSYKADPPSETGSPLLSKSGGNGQRPSIQSDEKVPLQFVNRRVSDDTSVNEKTPVPAQSPTVPAQSPTVPAQSPTPSGSTEKPQSPTQTQPSAPPYSYLNSSAPSTPSARAEGEIDYRQQASVNDIRLRFERRTSETSDKNITRI